MKPFKGEIHQWYRNHFDVKDYPGLPTNLGYNIIGRPSGHPDFINWIYTSAVVKHDLATGEIETLNSRYKLI